MPLDRVHGEVLEGLPASMHVVVSPRHLADMNNLLVPYLKKKKFGHEEKVRPLFDDAVQHALDAFKAAGALSPVRFDEDDCLVQVYPKEGLVAVIFQRMIVGETKYVIRTYPLPEPVIQSLLANSGQSIREH